MAGRYVTLETPHGRERWHLVYEAQPGKYGEVDWKARKIRLNPKQSIEEMVDTVIHECCHVATGDALSEDWIGKIAGGATRALLILGLIRTEED